MFLCRRGVRIGVTQIYYNKMIYVKYCVSLLFARPVTPALVTEIVAVHIARIDKQLALKLRAQACPVALKYVAQVVIFPPELRHFAGVAVSGIDCRTNTHVAAAQSKIQGSTKRMLSVYCHL